MRLLQLASKFNKIAQVLPFGQSSLSLEEIRSKLIDYKRSIETMPVEPRPGWPEPGRTAIDVIDKVISNQEVSDTDKQWAVLDVQTNFRLLDPSVLKKYLSYNTP